MSRARTIALAALGGAALFALGRASISAPAVAPVREAPVAARERIVRVAVPGTSAARLDDRDVARIRDEVIAAIPPRAEADDPRAAAPAAAPADTATADGASEQLVDEALAAGRWTSADRRALGGRLGAMSQPARERALARLTTAINRGELAIEAGSSPL
ncbi:MAG: hypothetical protein K8W52_46555 [Deltaproteobacteria bacterium]|nr:hypothetical protein [Deltaproteobacteria bacterium]